MMVDGGKKKGASCQCLGKHSAFCRGANGLGSCVACCGNKRIVRWWRWVVVHGDDDVGGW